MPSQMSFERACAIAFSLVSAASLTSAGPCDIYADGDTPCVAAHSTTRALYDDYSGALYQVTRGSDNTTLDISPLSAGGVADADSQDSFCSLTTCLISIIYDQSGNGNHLTQGPPGGFDGPDVDGYDNLASAVGAPVTLNGQKAYGVFMSPGCGYRNDNAVGTATGDEAEGMYAVLDGTHYNSACCFDYGNAETSATDTGAGHMEAIYFGTSTGWGYGEGSGPWLMADMENGLFSGYASTENSADPSISYRFFTSIVKGEADEWALRGGNAASGSLTTYYSGIRPSGYNPMDKEGAIILGIGGDNSNGAQGTFYEGVMTTGYPSADTENSVQANIVAAGYAVTSLVSGPTLTAGDVVSIRVTTSGYTDRWIAHTGTTVNTQVVSSSSSTTLKEEASWKIVEGLGYSGCFSFESVDTPGSYIRHSDFVLLLNEDDGTTLFATDATFCPETAMDGDSSYSSLRSWSYPTRYFRHYENVMYAASNGGVQDFDATTSFNDDVSWNITTAFAT
ncbi:fungal alpha-L-arabinofuranosidase [Penicillium malachiteum]|uniref:Alpha-L-arabinofuranosidase n=1 Tax=Penicillium malachiteum TaxID=1324776 RepID=A0AAD6MY91_9EURO|nr:fungal alpha-L-arabinofuranosidase [Penicillium malachiteum]